jgi:hypothetical protein
VPDPDDRAGEALISAIERLAQQGGTPSLYGGAARVGWTVAHHASGEDADAACAAIDEVLLRQVDGWTRDYDLISGLVGFGVYALERGEVGAALASAVVTGLEQYMARGWLTAPELLPAHQRVAAPDGYVNLGLAHGIPGVVSVLAQFCKRGFEPEERLVLHADLVGPLDHDRTAARHVALADREVTEHVAVRVDRLRGDRSLRVGERFEPEPGGGEDGAAQDAAHSVCQPSTSLAGRAAGPT